MLKKYPEATKKFCAWIDEYKTKVEWDKLFKNLNRAENKQVKFHDIPKEMQIGVIMKFAGEFIPTTKIDDGFQLDKMKEFVESILGQIQLQ